MLGVTINGVTVRELTTDRIAMQPFRSALLASILLVGTLCNPGCRREAPHPTDEAGRPLQIAMVEPSSIDPSKLAGSPGRKIVSSLFTGLTTRAASGEVVPGCAKEWSHSENARQWQFTLRDGLMWSDGEPVTAQTFVDSWARSTSPSTQNPSAEMFDIIAGARERRTGKPVELGVQADGTNKLSIRTSRPCIDLPKRLAGAWASPVPIHAIERYGKQWTAPNHIVTNGPYILSEYTPLVSMVFRQNERSFITPRIRTVTTRFTSEPVDAVRWYDLGTVDWVDNLIPQATLSKLRRQTKTPLRSSPYLGVTYIIPNLGRANIDLPLRRALNLTVDRNKLVKQVLDGSQVPLARPIPRDLLGTPRGARLNPTLARRIFGSSRELRTKPLELMFYAGGRNRLLAEFLQRGWKEHLGIHVTLRSMEWKSFLASTASGEFDLALFSLGGYDAADLLSVFESDSPNNRGSYRSERVDELIKSAALAQTTANHNRYLSQAEAELVLDVATISLFQLTRHALVRPDLAGWESNMDDYHPWWPLYWRK